MKNTLFILLIFSVLFNSCQKEPLDPLFTSGCMDVHAINYDISADNQTSASCDFSEIKIIVMTLDENAHPVSGVWVDISQNANGGPLLGVNGSYSDANGMVELKYWNDYYFDANEEKSTNAFSYEAQGIDIGGTYMIKAVKFSENPVMVLYQAEATVVMPSYYNDVFPHNFEEVVILTD